jgi:UPF0176 protein
VSAIENISAYRFVALPDVAELRPRLHDQALRRALRGTVLLAEEGINLVLAGAPDDVRGFLQWLRQDARFADMAVKASASDRVPFGKLVVKIKREIIRMNHPAIRPQQGRAPSVAPTTLARWLARGCDDDDRPVVILDTRNGFEVDHGRFRDAIDWRLRKFSDFPAALLAHRDALRGKTVVSYSTGGIRCEKAALVMREAGVERALQLEGGILAYFEAVGSAHFDGGCFVFDDRAVLDASLAPLEPLGVAREPAS